MDEIFVKFTNFESAIWYRNYFSILQIRTIIITILKRERRLVLYTHDTFHTFSPCMWITCRILILNFTTAALTRYCIQTGYSFLKLELFYHPISYWNGDGILLRHIRRRSISSKKRRLCIGAPKNEKLQWPKMWWTKTKKSKHYINELQMTCASLMYGGGTIQTNGWDILDISVDQYISAAELQELKNFFLFFFIQNFSSHRFPNYKLTRNKKKKMMTK